MTFVALMLYIPHFLCHQYASVIYCLLLHVLVDALSFHFHCDFSQEDGVTEQTSVAFSSLGCVQWF